MAKSKSFKDGFEKETSKMGGISTAAPSPKFWLDSGSVIINKIISGSYVRGIPQGRLIQIAGPSGAGKSFIAGNIVKAAINSGDYIVLVIDSENALDDDFMTAIGADVVDNENYIYRGVKTIDQVVKIVSKFTSFYRDSGSDKKCLIVIDSLDMLQTKSENAKYEKGEIGGDQGQHAKQLKKMLAGFVQDIKSLPIAMVCTKQVYKEQDPIAALTFPWVVTEALKFAFSQILLVTKLMLKDKDTKNYEGIRLKAFGYKTRFTKPFQSAVIEVPYDEGMDRYSGLLEVAINMGIVTQSGAWYTFGEKKFQRKQITEELMKDIFDKVVERDEEVLEISKEEEEILSDDGTPAKVRRLVPGSEDQ